MKSGRWLPYARLILPQWAPARLYPKFSGRKRRSSDAGAATAENTAPPQDVPAGWAGSTVWPPDTVSYTHLDVYKRQVYDNGRGMEQEVLDHIFDAKNGEEKSGIGICNVQMRLQLYYGMEYGLSLIHILKQMRSFLKKQER